MSRLALFLPVLLLLVVGCSPKADDASTTPGSGSTTPATGANVPPPTSPGATAPAAGGGGAGTNAPAATIGGHFENPNATIPQAGSRAGGK